MKLWYGVLHFLPSFRLATLVWHFQFLLCSWFLVYVWHPCFQWSFPCNWFTGWCLMLLITILISIFGNYLSFFFHSLISYLAVSGFLHFFHVFDFRLLVLFWIHNILPWSWLVCISGFLPILKMGVVGDWLHCLSFLKFRVHGCSSWHRSILPRLQHLATGFSFVFSIFDLDLFSSRNSIQWVY